MSRMTDIVTKPAAIADTATSLMVLSDLMDQGTRYRLEMMLASDIELLDAIQLEMASFRDTYLTSKEDAPCETCRL